MVGDRLTVVLNPLSAMLDLLLPPRCAGCGAGDTALCARCRAGFSRPGLVYRSAAAHGPPIYALADYAGVPRTVVLTYKERGRRDLAGPLAELLVAALAGLVPPSRATQWLVPVPSRSRTARSRGGQHMLRLARHCAAAMAEQGKGATVAPALRMTSEVRDSVGLSAEQRLANLSGRLRPVLAGLPPTGTRVVLMDDVVTSGATVATATTALANVGIEVAAVLALTATPDVHLARSASRAPWMVG